MEKFPSRVAENFPAGWEIPVPYVDPTASLQISRDFATTRHKPVQTTLLLRVGFFCTIHLLYIILCL
jgi:hypothetical protein